MNSKCRAMTQDVVNSGDRFKVWSTVNGDDREIPAHAVQAFAQEGLDLGEAVTEYAAPTATGFTVTLTGEDNLWLILTPSAAYAAGAIVLPATPVDKQSVTVACSQAVTTLTVSGGTNTVRGAPATLAADGFFTLRFDDVTNVWVRVG